MLGHSQPKLLPVVSAVFVSFCCAVSVFAQMAGISESESQTNLGGNNSIIGTVFGPSGRPLEQRVRIRLSTMTRGDRNFTTNENGAFAFRGLTSGSYTITIDKEPDYKPSITSVDVVQLRGGGGPPTPTVVTVNIRLEYKDREKPGVINAELAAVPEKARTHYKNGVEESKKGNREAAIAEFKLAIEENPTFPMAII